jgi:TRAP-type mannitol/chloroaromatic compound transport system permease large subunit
MPSVVLVGGYIIYVLVVSYLDPQAAPIFKSNKCNLGKAEKYFKVAKAIVPPISLIVARFFCSCVSA